MTNSILSNPPSLTIAEMYEAVTAAHGLTSHRDIKPIHVAGFVPIDADSGLVARMLRNFGYGLSQPKKQRVSRSKGNRKHNHAERVARTDSILINRPNGQVEVI